ncbi:MAG: Trm112 family protein [Deltaproteobacteria bacterium]|nr:Trm112 family protein [Deltaproteobacteria bacterium]
MISDKFLAMLACPVCKGELVQSDTGGLRCYPCCLEYPVKGDIPVLLPDEAKRIPRLDTEAAKP